MRVATPEDRKELAELSQQFFKIWRKMIYIRSGKKDPGILQEAPHELDQEEH